MTLIMIGGYLRNKQVYKRWSKAKGREFSKLVQGIELVAEYEAEFEKLLKFASYLILDQMGSKA